MLNRRKSKQISIGNVKIGGDAPISVQSMCNTDTRDVQSTLDQISELAAAGCEIVRLAVLNKDAAAAIKDLVKKSPVPLVADIHFDYRLALTCIENGIQALRINPGNIGKKEHTIKVVEAAKSHNVPIRIGINGGSLEKEFAQMDIPLAEKMVKSALRHVEILEDLNFYDTKISLKSSDVPTTIEAYRLIAKKVDYPLHLGVTEAGNGIEGRIKSAVGIGALLADGVGDTIRVSLTEAPENEIPVAKALVNYFSHRSRATYVRTAYTEVCDPFSYTRRQTIPEGRLGGNNIPLLYSELNSDEMAALTECRIALLTANGNDPVSEWRRAITDMQRSGDTRPVILHRRYDTCNTEALALEAAADFGVMFIDGLADGIYVEATGVQQSDADTIALDILQAARARMSKTEFISCPGCGRTLYALHDTLAMIKERLSHLRGLKIGVMGCIVNGPGEMADADYGYVGAAPGHISLYRGREAVRRNIPQEKALDALVELIKADGRWVEP